MAFPAGNVSLGMDSAYPSFRACSVYNGIASDTARILTWPVFASDISDDRYAIHRLLVGIVEFLFDAKVDLPYPLCRLLECF